MAVKDDPAHPLQTLTAEEAKHILDWVPTLLPDPGFDRLLIDNLRRLAYWESPSTGSSE